MNQKSRSKGRGRRLAVTLGLVAAFIGSQGHAASFPDYPLQTGVGSIAPNIMFILDDSGSMTRVYMPSETDGAWPGDNIQGRSYLYNTLSYDPRIEYKPWMQSDGTRMTGGTTYESAFAHFSLASLPIDLSNSDSCNRSMQNGERRWVCGGEQTFYIPKPGQDAPGTDKRRYYKYVIRVNKNVERCEWVPATEKWENCVLDTPSDRGQKEERDNYATWFSYHRTRMKAAKAGASEAFAGLGENFRVGYDSIWNRLGESAVSGTLPAYPIPVARDDGKFDGENRATWFNHLFAALGSGNTPLHGALQRAGNYYETEVGANGPWGPQVGEAQLSCRQNYAILTTDGYWNNKSSYTPVGDADSTQGEEIESADGQRTYQYTPARPFTDGRSDTLADVAMHYWKRDLRADLANNVPSTSGNDAYWQHMVTFGVSIGAQGTISPADVQLIEQGSLDWPNPLTNAGRARIDDLLHASVNARGSFVAASNPQEFEDALKDSLAAIARRRSSGSNVASNGPSLNNGSHLFQATYTSGEWSGDVHGISIVGGMIAATPSWSMAAVANEDPATFLSRPVYTSNGSAGVAFPTATQRDQLVRNAGMPGQVNGTENASYIRGDRSGEGASPNALRRRTSPIGDIVNSSPFYVPERNTLFIGANDGMLHGLDASSGTTLFSYVPRGLDFGKLATLSSQEYEHHFFVDGGIDVTTTAQGGGKNILVASLGRGGKGVFALDVTATGPDQLSPGMVLWDKTFQDTSSGGQVSAVEADDMGYLLGAPLVRQGNNGKTLVIVPNGIDSAKYKAVLFIYVLGADGRIESTVRIQAGNDGNAGRPNGLAEVRAADVTGDGKADYLYAGDLYGNVWRFDITPSNSNQWTQSSRLRHLFTTPANQPITAAVALARHPVTGRTFVVFGTGRYVTNGDLTSTSVQSMYALIDTDSGTFPITQSELQQRTIPISGVDSLGRAARAWESYSELGDGKRGWYVNLGVPVETAKGERVVTAPFVRGRALWFSSIIPQPGAGCDSGGTGYLNAVDAFTGTNPASTGGRTETFIDVNSDGQGNDRIAGHTGDNEAGYVTSVDLGIGMPSQGVGVGNAIYACGSDAECGRTATPASSTGPKRLRWRELVGDE